MPRFTVPQVTNFKKIFGSGFLLQIHHVITSSHVKFITLGPVIGSPKVLYTTNGKRRALSCGCMGNVCPRSFVLRIRPADRLGFGSGIGEERTVVGHSVHFFCQFCNVVEQFFDHQRCRSHTCDRIGFSRVLLLRFQRGCEAGSSWITFVPPHPTLRSIPSSI